MFSSVIEANANKIKFLPQSQIEDEIINNAALIFSRKIFQTKNNIFYVCLKFEFVMSSYEGQVHKSYSEYNKNCVTELSCELQFN